MVKKISANEYNANAYLTDRYYRNWLRPPSKKSGCVVRISNPDKSVGAKVDKLMVGDLEQQGWAFGGTVFAMMSQGLTALQQSGYVVHW